MQLLRVLRLGLGDYQRLLIDGQRRVLAVKHMEGVDFHYALQARPDRSKVTLDRVERIVRVFAKAVP
jgi:hypothetical protein